MKAAFRHYIAIALPTLNEVIGEARRNKFAGAKQKHKYTNAIAALCAGLPELRGCYHWRFTWYWRDRRSNPDNIASAVKFVFDGLQQAGVIANDGWGQVASIEHRFEVADVAGVLMEAYE